MPKLKKKTIKITFYLITFAAITAIVVVNNSSIRLPKSQYIFSPFILAKNKAIQTKMTNVSASGQQPSNFEQTSALAFHWAGQDTVTNVTTTNNKSGLADSSAPPFKRGKLHVVGLSGIRCPFVLFRDVELLISLELFVEDGPLYNEVLLKREDLKVMVINSIQQSAPDNIKVNLLEYQLKQSMNTILKNGLIDSIRCVNFEVKRMGNS